MERATETISVGTLLLVSLMVEEELVYKITQALWNKTSRLLLDSGHEKGKTITLDSALDGVAIPLHPGASRFCEEVGLKFNSLN